MNAQPAAALRVLIVDPEASLQDLLIELLSDKGHVVDTASDSPEAIRKISEGSYDLIVTDDALDPALRTLYGDRLTCVSLEGQTASDSDASQKQMPSVAAIGDG